MMTRKYQESPTDLLTMVHEKDRDWAEDSRFHTSYDFSNGRRFEVYEAPTENYAWYQASIEEGGILLDGTSLWATDSDGDDLMQVI